MFNKAKAQKQDYTKGKKTMARNTIQSGQTANDSSC